ncbi:MAG: efflux RND transporter periplasmic adaptor subunit [Bacteroidetes bacterium]|nr:efflux RND transporter periplasmic adaptor subunit [Bacteroidota bacterium]
MRMLTNRWLIAVQIVVGIALLVLVITPVLRSREDAPQEERARPGTHPDIAFPVTCAVARRADLVKRLSTGGTLRASQEVEIQSRVAGQLTEVRAWNGRFVRSGECLAVIDDREYLVALERARATLLNAQIDFTSLSATPFLSPSDSMETRRSISAELHSLDSLRQILRSGLIDHETYERLSREKEASLAYLTANRGDVIAGRSGLAQAREAFEAAKLNLEATTIKAPFPGHIADCVLSPGAYVSAGQLLLKVVNVSTLFVDVDVLESEISSIAVGQKAGIRVMGLEGEECEGVVAYVNPLVNAKTRTMTATIALHAGNRNGHAPSVFLRPGMYATVLIETRVLPNRHVVPRSARLVRDQRPLVFIVNGQVAKWHYVETGESDEASIEILSGIEAGDTVIVDGQHTLAHDARITVIKTKP